MRIPLSLIQSFIRLDLHPAQIAETLTLLGLEVDGIEPGRDPVFEISLTPNLGHCMSALGVARELAAALQKPIHRPKPSLKISDQARLEIKGEADPKLCPRYMCRLIEGVSIAPSPPWLQKQLLACGLTPLSNAVDIANFIMLKLGQPLHVFDFDQLEGTALHIGASSSPQKFLGLDGVERDVPAGTIFVSDASRPVAIAGILGSKSSAVSERTQKILVEAAIFDPASLRQASKKMGLRTESSQRFEKGVDPNGTPAALDEACALILELCGGELASGTVDLKARLFSPLSLSCRTDLVNRFLGTSLSLTEIEGIFRRLGFESQEKEKGLLEVRVPLFRSDIKEEIDLIEEVARIYGYHHIEKTPPRSIPSQIPHDSTYLFEKEIRERLIGFGLQEFLNSDLISEKASKLALEWIRSDASLLSAIHAKTEEYSVLRPSLLPGLLQAARANFNYKTLTLSAFEIGRIHFLQNNQLVEEPMAAILISGPGEPFHWSRKASDSDFFDLKGHLNNLFEALRIPAPLYRPSEHPSFHPGRQADIYCENQLVGSFGEIHPALLEKADIEQRILYAEINLHLLMQQPRSQARMRPLPQFPSSERDWTIPLPSQTLIASVFDAIRSTQSLLLEKVELIDLYVPEKSEMKNATLRFTYRDPLKTISFEEVENAHAKLIASVKRSFS